MNEVKVFNNEQFGQIRTIVGNGEPWFVAADVCRALGIANPSDALRRLDDDEKALVSIEGLSRGNDSGNIVNEPGLYSLVLGSRKPEAKAFKRWITHDVIPTIRKTGGYVNNEELFVESYFSNSDERTKAFIKAQLAEARIAKEKIAQLEPKARYCDMVLQCPDAVPITTIAKDYGWSAQKMNKWLAEQGIQYKLGKTWYVYQKFADKGCTQSKTTLIGSDNAHAVVHTCWTQEGRLFIYEMMKKDGILPLIEQRKLALQV